MRVREWVNVLAAVYAGFRCGTAAQRVWACHRRLV
jgi:hypothetical protein